jgi:hypothetical protein
MWVGGPRVVCPDCPSTTFVLDWEEYDGIDHVLVGLVHCSQCQQGLLYKRRHDQPLVGIVNRDILEEWPT